MVLLHIFVHKIIHAVTFTLNQSMSFIDNMLLDLSQIQSGISDILDWNVLTIHIYLTYWYKRE